KFSRKGEAKIIHHLGEGKRNTETESVQSRICVDGQQLPRSTTTMTVVTSVSPIRSMFSDRDCHKWSLDQLCRQQTSGNSQTFQSVPENTIKDNAKEEEAILCNTGLDLSRLRAEEQYYFGEASEEDIVWVPSRARYQQRQLAKSRRPALHPMPSPPRGFPAEISGPEVWTGDEMQGNRER